MGFFRKSSSKSLSKSESAPTSQRYLDAGHQVSVAKPQRPPLNYQPTYEYQPYNDIETEYVNVDGDGAVYEQTGRRYQNPYHHAPHSAGISTLRMKGAYDHDDNDDFDDAASYHSISSNPGNPRPKAANASAPVTANHNYSPYAHTMPSRYMQMAAQGRGAARSNNPAIDSYYSTAGDDDVNVFRSAGQSPENISSRMSQTKMQLGHDHFLQAPSANHSSSMNSPAMSMGSAGAFSSDGRSPDIQRQQQQQHFLQQRRLPPVQETAAPKSDQELGEEYFQKAVNFHEQGDLASATGYFKRAADRHNPLGMLFYGLSLRHGWGCQPNENLAFVFLQKAGEHVVSHVKDMDPAVAGMAKDELAMAIYELGQSYRHGWGVSRNKKTAAYYFEVAAELGDTDAQSDIAACYEKGDGVKRDMKKAAHYYRLAHKQGVELFGTSWIFKKKYDSD
ncbi:hypothetical protein LPJ64_000321 [Coemansia asiatica]|uniref:HCP-like protein n=1 Tax=Coemansia asiatica TaxID=1052880 RepID=A0A9W8CMG7_9FUNG|nr:hypothetical protein LPJ64_000321 [Coemansia asiatica]